MSEYADTGDTIFCDACGHDREQHSKPGAGCEVCDCESFDGEVLADGYNVPTLYIDGERFEDGPEGRTMLAEFDPTELERVQLEFDATANGAQSEADERAPLGWCNSATIHLDREEDSVTVLISVGDPRGAFAFTVRRLTAGDNAGKLIMHTPYPGEPMPHMSLTELRPGTYEIGS